MRVGILGGGQLAKMLVLSGYPLGLSFHLYEPDMTCCSAEMAPITHADFTDQVALNAFAEQVDIITYENENIPVASLQLLQGLKPIFPSIEAIKITQDRLLEKECLKALAIPTTAFLAVNTIHDVERAAAMLQYPFIVKTRHHGYDGKGQVIIRSASDSHLVSESMLATGCIAEAWVNYRREFSVISVSALSSKTRFYDVCENVHQHGILAKTENKKNDPALAAVMPYIERLLAQFSYHGVMTVEFFEDQSGHYLVNEIAPRVHNSGHWTIEGAYTSQFQNHLRAGLDWPIGNTESLYAIQMDNILGKLPMLSSVLLEDGVYPHFYGKAEKPGRKLGHITKIIRK